MLTTYFKIAIRNLKRHKLFSAINILGLTIGMATCMLIMLYVKDELSYDRFHKKADRIVRVVFKGSVQGEQMNEAHVMPPVAQTLRADYPEVQEATRLRNGGYPRISYGDKSFREDALAFADSNIFEVFTLPLLKGDSKTALLEPNTIVISKDIAEKYFGTEDPINKSLNLDSDRYFKVTGIMENIPRNSHFYFDLFASMASLPEARESSWMTSEFYTYLVLPEGYDYKKLEDKLPQAVEKYMGPQLQKSMGISFSEFKQKGNSLGLVLQPLTDIHLKSDFSYDLGSGGNIQYVYIFTVIALFMLLIACINFINLSTAAASKRAKEVGIRKVLGSERIQLIRQFLTESIVITFIALALAVGFVKIALPLFNQLSGKDLNLQLTSDPWLLPAIILTGLVTAVFAGSYPALFLSSFQPVTVLKGKFQAGKNGISLRSGLVVFQFFISASLIIGTVVVFKQLQYIKNKSLGYNREQILVLRETGRLGQKEDILRGQLLEDTRILSVSNSGYLPAGPTNNNNFFVYPGNENALEQVKTLRYDVDDQYLPTLGIKLIAGRNFSKDLASDSAAVIINEAAVRSFGWGKNAVGKTLSAANNHRSKTTYQVIGVVKDFHFKSLHERISPLVMVLGQNDGLIVKLRTKDSAGLLATVKKHWADLSPEEPFNYSFLDENFRRSYEFEQKVGQILGIFAGLTILVACLGLLGLVTFATEQRTKEIGIRKVLGASVTNIVALLSKDFLKLILVANILAWPIAWWIMNTWLNDFAYRINISAGILIASGALTVLIAVLIIGIKAVKAGKANPVESLRTE